ncbi:MAG TPA: flagellar biosynthetic protein FliO [Rubrivivax sp.]|nr:flagellar biosynthetic protein FliO [Burkholderiales bacterium]HNT37518.1 flagellar biosynthetic protein FliO [Rubrivivax sp.]
MLLQDWTSLLWLALVLLAIPAALWLLKRTPLAQAGRPGTARMVAVLPLSTSQRVVTVEVGHGEQRLWLVLGVTPQGISNLYTMAPQDEAAAPASPAATLNPLLQRLRGRTGGGDAR